MTTDPEFTAHKSTDRESNETEEELVRRIHELVGPAPEGERVSEQLIRERREEAARREDG